MYGIKGSTLRFFCFVGLAWLCWGQLCWGASREVDCCDPYRFAPPPPDVYPLPPALPPSRHLRLERPSPFMQFLLGDVELWGQPYSGHLTLNMDFMDIQFLAPVSGGDWMIGASMSLVSMRSERWLGKLHQGDHWLNTRKWGRFEYFMGNHLFRLQAGFRVYRQVEWGLPEGLAEVLLKERGGVSGKKGEGGLESQAPMLMLPGGKMGLTLGPVAFELGGELLSWDLRGFRGDAELSVRGKGVKISVKTSFIQDAARFAQPTIAVWKMRTWESKATLELDLLHFFRKDRRSFWGPVLLRVGVRYRQVLDNHLVDLSGNDLFREAMGGEWSVAGGLSIGFGSRDGKMFR